MAGFGIDRNAAATSAGAPAVSAFGASLIDDADAAEARATLGAASSVDVDAVEAAVDALETAVDALEVDVGTLQTDVTTLDARVDAVWSTGDTKLTFKTVADSGWVLMNDGTMGNAASGGTTRANADTEALFTLFWTNIADAQCAVSTGRGASAAADFAAGKTIALPKALGRALAVFGAGSGLTSRALAFVTGTETHVLVTDEMPAHSHGVTDPGHTHSEETNASNSKGNDSVDSGGTNQAGTTGSNTTGISIQNTGGDGAHENMQPTMFLNAMVKL